MDSGPGVGNELPRRTAPVSRAQSPENIDAEFIELVRAKGTGSRRVARYLLRNATVPLLSLFFVDMLGIVVLNAFVIEYVFGIQGLGGLSLVAIQSRDILVILGTSLVIVLVACRQFRAGRRLHRRRPTSGRVIGAPPATDTIAIVV